MWFSTHWDFFVSFTLSLSLSEDIDDKVKWKIHLPSSSTCELPSWRWLVPHFTFHLSSLLRLFLCDSSSHSAKNSAHTSLEMLNNFTNNTKYLTTVPAHSRDSYISNFLIFYSLSWQSSSLRWLLNVWQRDNESDGAAEKLLSSSLPVCLHVPSRPRTILIALDVDETTTNEQSRISLVTEYYFYEQTR